MKFQVQIYIRYDFKLDMNACANSLVGDALQVPQPKGWKQFKQFQNAKRLYRPSLEKLQRTIPAKPKSEFIASMSMFLDMAMQVNGHYTKEH